ncbi:MAG: hypothetical protein EBY89_01005 [Actinobacteria bacterium]|nr:hypothetical protein [Actinomycetota bacterium]
MLVVIATMVAMEPITYALHRWVMHGFGLTLHLSHHRNAARTKPTRLELNDLYPVIFALVVVGLLAIGFNAPQAGILVPIGIGATIAEQGSTFPVDRKHFVDLVTLTENTMQQMVSRMGCSRLTRCGSSRGDFAHPNDLLRRKARTSQTVPLRTSDLGAFHR